MKLLIIEDDEQVLEFIKKGLQEEMHQVDSAFDGQQGLYLATTGNYDVIIIDRMLPKIDGITIIKTLRGSGNNVPILILSALGDADHRVEGLRSGSDDYLIKPFSFDELSARVEILHKRAFGSEENKVTTLRVQDLEIDLLSRTVIRDGEKIELQTREFNLLEYLVRNAGRVVTRTMLLEKLWDYSFDPQTNVIDVHVSRLRSKIDKHHDIKIIKTVRGSGYIVNK